MTTRTIAAGLAIAMVLGFGEQGCGDEVWTGLVKQNSGAADCTALMRLCGDDGRQTEHPELKGGGKLTRVAQSGADSFCIEKATSAGTGCSDGAITPWPRATRVSRDGSTPTRAGSTWRGAA